MKTDLQIVEDCNRLAHEFYRLHGFHTRNPNFKFWEARNGRENLMWQLALKAYEVIEGTPVDDALKNLETEDVPDFIGAGL